MNYLKVTIEFCLGTAFHTTGNRRRWEADKALALDVEGQYVIPATTVKGFLREKAELLLRTWGHQVCTGPEPSRMCDSTSLCLVCQVFGNPRHSSPLRFSDARFTAPAFHAIGTAIRSGVAISRYRRAASPQRLFFVETTQAMPTHWIATCEGYFQSTQAAQEAAALLALAAAWGTAIGGGRSRGLGWLTQSQVKEAFLDGEPIALETLEQFWRDWEGGKDVATN